MGRASLGLFSSVGIAFIQCEIFPIQCGIQDVEIKVVVVASKCFGQEKTPLLRGSFSYRFDDDFHIESSFHTEYVNSTLQRETASKR
jgi:hypothetical protein